MAVHLYSKKSKDTNKNDYKGQNYILDNDLYWLKKIHRIKKYSRLYVLSYTRSICLFE